MSRATLLHVCFSAVSLLPTTIGNVAQMEPEVTSGSPAVTSMLQRTAEERRLKEPEEEEEEEELSYMDHDFGHLERGVTCGQTCSNLAPEHGASCAALATTAEATDQRNDAVQIRACEAKESNSNHLVEHVEHVEHVENVEHEKGTSLLDAISWPLFLAGIGLLVAGQFDGWDRLLDGTELQCMLPDGSVRKLLTVIGLLAFAEGSTLFDARAFALSFVCGLSFLVLPLLVTYRRHAV